MGLCAVHITNEVSRIVGIGIVIVGMVCAARYIRKRSVEGL